jgi:exonuclease VII small subunit
MKTNTKIKFEEALKNAESYIEEMKTWDDKKLCKHLDLFQKQMQMAYEQRNHEAFELLQEYERQVLVGRMRANFKE